MNNRSVDSSLWQLSNQEHVPTSTLEGDSHVDLVILGGGFTGCSAALHAAELGMTTCLLEAASVGYGGSGRNVGLVNAGLWMPPDLVEEKIGQDAGLRLNTMLGAAPDLVFELIEKHKIACEPVRNGTLHCAHSVKGLMEIDDRYSQLLRRGAPVSRLDDRQTASKTGSHQFLGALHDARAGTIQPLAYCVGLARAAQRAGAQIYTNSAAISIERKDDKWHVQTANGLVVAQAMLMATNAYHANITGVLSPNYIPVHYFQLATQPLSADEAASVLPGGQGCWDTATVMSSFRMDATGRLIVGAIGSLGHMASHIHKRWARLKLKQLYPALGSARLENAWHGRIAMTSDHLPKIVSMGPNALSIFGYSGRGIGPGTLFGATAAAFLAEGDEDVLPIRVVGSHPERFSAIKMAYYETGACVAHLAPG